MTGRISYSQADINHLRAMHYLMGVGEVLPDDWVERLIDLGWMARDESTDALTITSMGERYLGR